MFLLVFNTPPPDDQRPFKETRPLSSWWVNVKRELWGVTYGQEWRERLQYQRKIEEPTARRESPPWATKKNKDHYARVDSFPELEAGGSIASTDRDDSTD